MNIEVILTQDDPKLGQRGELVKVSHGYAHNFLIPHNKAKLATPSNLKAFVDEQQRKAKEAERLRAEAAELAKRIQATSLTVEMLVGEGEKLYGAVTNHDIQNGLAGLGIILDKKAIHLEEPIKKLGAYKVTVKLLPDVGAELKVWVVKKKP